MSVPVPASHAISLGFYPRSFLLFRDCIHQRSLGWLLPNLEDASVIPFLILLSPAIGPLRRCVNQGPILRRPRPLVSSHPCETSPRVSWRNRTASCRAPVLTSPYSRISQLESTTGAAAFSHSTRTFPSGIPQVRIRRLSWVQKGNCA